MARDELLFSRDQRVVESALDLMRPAGEHWSVTMAETATTLRLDFQRDTDAPRSITVASDGDDDQHSQLFGSVCGFLWAYWPTARRPS
jgi:hypothetical protein